MAGNADKFDPYHKWLGIPPREQPPNHYRLLGLDLFEADAEVVEAAASRLIAFCESQASGEHAAEARQIVVELASARLQLLDSQQRNQYDTKLRAKIAAKSKAAQPSLPADRGGVVRRPARSAPTPSPPVVAPHVAKTSSSPLPQAKSVTPEIVNPTVAVRTVAKQPAQPVSVPAAPKIQIQTTASGRGNAATTKGAASSPPPIADSTSANVDDLSQLFDNVNANENESPGGDFASLAISLQSETPPVAATHGKHRSVRKRDSGKHATVAGLDKSAKKRKQQRQMLIVGGMALGSLILIIAGVIVLSSDHNPPQAKTKQSTSVDDAEAALADTGSLEDEALDLHADEPAADVPKLTAPAMAKPTAQVEPKEETSADEGMGNPATETVADAGDTDSGDEEPDAKSVTERLLEVSQRGGSDAQVKKLIREKADLEAVDADRRTPLRLAVISRRVPIVRALLDAKADVNTTDRKGETPLMSAAQTGDARLVTMLLEAGADPNAVTVGASSGITALHLAARQGHAEVTKLLLENGANRDSATQAGKTPLMIAAWQGHEAVALLLIDKGANVQTAIDRDGQTALMHAAHGGNLAIVNAMLQKGAIVNQKSTAGASALAIALGVPAPNPAVLARLRNAVETEAPSLDF